MAIKKRLGKFGSRFAFEWTLEMMHDTIVKGLRKYLAPIKAEGIPRMVRKGQFPPLTHLDFSEVSDNAEHLERISEVRLMEYLAEARPDLALAIQNMGMVGAKYIAKLRLHLLELVKHPEKALAVPTDYAPKQEMARATCDKCGKSWAVPKSEAGSLDRCPFCEQ